MKQRIPFFEYPVDLSHFDLKDSFTAYEAACLVAGVDPYVTDRNELFGTPEWGRVRVIEDSIEDSFKAVEEAFSVEAETPAFTVGAAVLIAPWSENDPEGEWIPMIHSIQQHEAFSKYAETDDASYLLEPRRIEDQRFMRRYIEKWLQAKQYRKACYFWTEQDRQKERGATATDEASEQKEIAQLKAEVSRLQSELAQAQASEPALDGEQRDDLDKLLRHIGALALLLAEKGGRYRVGDKPNALQIAEGVITILDGLPDASRRGLGSSSLRDSIGRGIALLTG